MKMIFFFVELYEKDFADAADSEMSGKKLMKVWNNDSNITISQIF